MAVWPTSLPKLGNVGARVGIDDPVARSQMDSGPPSRRNRFSSVTRPVSVQMALTGAQLEVLEEFFFVTTRNGSLSFDWTHPVTGATISSAFKTPLDSVSRIGGPVEDDRVWVTSFELEIQP